jgi:cytoskeletal protein CcmA (bactofilin family)
MAKITAPHLVIGQGARFVMQDTLSCETLQVSGELRARVAASGPVTVTAGGALQGELRGRSLTVEDGGSLRAKLRIGGPRPRKPGKKKSTKKKQGRKPG